MKLRTVSETIRETTMRTIQSCRRHGAQLAFGKKSGHSNNHATDRVICN